MWMVVGLGNLAQNMKTRHNAGFWFIDALAARYPFKPFEETPGYHLAKSADRPGALAAEKVLLLKPMAYMNRSGAAVAKMMQLYKLPLTRVIVVHDDLDLAPGDVRFKQGGGHAGHNGLKDIDRCVGKGYRRLRMGVGRPEHRGEVVSYVLNPPLKEEREAMASLTERLVEHAALMLTEPFNSGPFLTEVHRQQRPQSRQLQWRIPPT